MRFREQCESIFFDNEAAFTDTGEVRSKKLYGLVASAYFMECLMIKIKAQVL